MRVSATMGGYTERPRGIGRVQRDVTLDHLTAPHDPLGAAHGPLEASRGVTLACPKSSK